MATNPAVPQFDGTPGLRLAGFKEEHEQLMARLLMAGRAGNLTPNIMFQHLPACFPRGTAAAAWFSTNKDQILADAARKGVDPMTRFWKAAKREFGAAQASEMHLLVACKQGVGEGVLKDEAPTAFGLRFLRLAKHLHRFFSEQSVIQMFLEGLLPVYREPVQGALKTRDANKLKLKKVIELASRVHSNVFLTLASSRDTEERTFLSEAVVRGGASVPYSYASARQRTGASTADSVADLVGRELAKRGYEQAFGTFSASERVKSQRDKPSPCTYCGVGVHSEAQCYIKHPHLAPVGFKPRTAENQQKFTANKKPIAAATQLAAPSPSAQQAADLFGEPSTGPTYTAAPYYYAAL